MRRLRRVDEDRDHPPRPRVLVIDRSDRLCTEIRLALRDHYAVASAPHGAAAIDPRANARGSARIILMGTAADLARNARQRGVDGHLRKPIEAADLRRLQILPHGGDDAADGRLREASC